MSCTQWLEAPLHRLLYGACNPLCIVLPHCDANCDIIAVCKSGKMCALYSHVEHIENTLRLYVVVYIHTENPRLKPFVLWVCVRYLGVNFLVTANHRCYSSNTWHMSELMMSMGQHTLRNSPRDKNHPTTQAVDYGPLQIKLHGKCVVYRIVHVAWTDPS